VLPSAGTELLDVLICDLLFDLNSASVPEPGQLCPILKTKRAVAIPQRSQAIMGNKMRNQPRPAHLLFSMLKFFAVMDELMVLSRLSDGGILLYDGRVPSESMIASFM